MNRDNDKEDIRRTNSKIKSISLAMKLFLDRWRRVTGSGAAKEMIKLQRAQGGCLGTKSR